MTDRTDPEDGLTIDALAQRTGMTVRNIRAHQSRGLLEGPEVRGRTGFYGAEHIARINLIRELQGEGLNLEAIRRLVRSDAGSGEGALAVVRRARGPFEEEEPAIIDAGQLAEAFGAEANPTHLVRAERIGALRPLGDGRYEVLSPRLLGAARELSELGVPLDVTLELAETVRRRTERVADDFVALFLEHVWQPFMAQGAPVERWQEIADALERVRPLAGSTVLAIFQRAMSDRAEAAFARLMAEPDEERSR